MPSTSDRPQMTTTDLGGHSIREVYRLVDKLRTELRDEVTGVAAEVAGVRRHIDATFQHHERRHERDMERRGSQLRWLVTTLIAIMALATAVASGLR